MSLDIMAALAAAPSRSDKKCKVRKILDDIPADADGRDKLVEVAECSDTRHPDYRSHKAMSVVLKALGTPASDGAVQAHRRHECICYR